MLGDKVDINFPLSLDVLERVDLGTGLAPGQGWPCGGRGPAQVR